MAEKNSRWQKLSAKKKLMILYLISLPFIIYGIADHFQRQASFEDGLDDITIDMMSCEAIDKAIYFNSISLSHGKKVDDVMLNLWFEGNCENPDSPYWRGGDWIPNINESIR